MPDDTDDRRQAYYDELDHTRPIPPEPSCKQKVLNIDKEKNDCRYDKNLESTNLVQSCPNWLLSVAVQGQFDVAKIASLGVSIGVAQAQSCEAREGFNLGTSLALCDKKASDALAALGPCD